MKLYKNIYYAAIRYAARIIACLIILCISIDAIIQGSIRVPDADLVNDKQNVDLHVSLPYAGNWPNAPNTTLFHFYFTLTPGLLDRLLPIHLHSERCIASFGLKSDVPPGKTNTPNNCWHDIRLFDKPVDSNQQNNIFDMVINLQEANFLNLTVLRDPVFDANQTTIALVIAVFLFSFSFIKKGYRRSFCYSWFVSMCFWLTFAFPPDVLVIKWRDYFSRPLILEHIYCPQPIVLFLSAFAAVTWPITRRWLLATVRVLRRVHRLPPKLFLPVCAAVFFTMAACLSQLLFDGLPHIADTHAQYIQSKIIASGRFYAPSHPLKDFFNTQFMYNNGKFYSNYAPGHVTLLAIGQLLGLPWLINPLLGALTVIATYLLAKEISGQKTGYVAVALLMTSSFVVFMSSEYMNHTTTLLFVTLFLYAYIRMHKTNDWRFGLAAGACIGYAFITRPGNIVPFAAPVALHALWWFASGYRTRWKAIAAMGLAFAVPAAYSSYYSYVTYQAPLALTVSKPIYWSTHPYNTPQEPSLGEDWRRMTQQLQFLHLYLFGWPGSSLVFVFILFLFRMQPPYAKLLFSCCAAQAASLMINPFSDELFGPRYMYETATCLITFSAVCIVRLPALLSRYTRASPVLLHGVMAWTIAMFTIIGFLGADTQLYALYADNYYEGNVPYYHMLLKSVQKPALVFMSKSEEFRLVSFTMPPNEADPVIFARDLGADNKKLMEFYPGRSAYIVTGENIKRIR